MGVMSRMATRPTSTARQAASACWVSARLRPSPEMKKMPVVAMRRTPYLAAWAPGAGASVLMGVTESL